MLTVFTSLLFWTDVEVRNPRVERIHVRDMRRDVFLRLHGRPRPLALAVDFKNDMYATKLFRKLIITHVVFDYQFYQSDKMALIMDSCE